MSNILITGYGSIGSLIARTLVKNHNLIIADYNERAIFKATTEFSDKNNVHIILADISRPDDVYKIFMNKIDIIIHTAALKHVNFCENNPTLAILNNVTGTDLIMKSALEKEISKAIFINTDKSVYPTSTMGATKFLAEKCLISYHTIAQKHNISTQFNSLRFGNVLNSNGSIIPAVMSKISNKLPINITNPEATRYFISPTELMEYAKLILKSDEKNLIIIKKMRSVKLSTIIDAILEYLGIKNYPQKIIGLQPGEKIHEYLYTELEAPYIIDRGEYLTIDPTSTPSNNKVITSEDNCIEYDEFLNILKNELSSSTVYYSKREV